jgi:hypothetical protein
MKCKANLEAGTLEFTFEGGLEPVRFDSGKVAECLRERAEMHGFEQRIRDNAAIAKSEKNNYTVTEQMRRDAVLEMVTHLEAGGTEWNLKAGTRAPAQNPVFLRIAAKFGISYDQAMAKVQEQMLGEVG